MPLKIIAGLFFIFCSLNGFTQVDSNKAFLASKGTWEYPLTYRHDYSGKCCDFPIVENATFYSFQASPVKALMPGKIVTKMEIDSMYVVIIQYGSYFITYSNLQKNSLKKGDLVQKGQLIGLPVLSFDGDRYLVDIFLNRYSENIDLNKSDWFKKECTSQPSTAL